MRYPNDLRLIINAKLYTSKLSLPIVLLYNASAIVNAWFISLFHADNLTPHAVSM